MKPINSIRIAAGTPEDLDAVITVETRCFSPCRRSSRRSLRHSLGSPSQQTWIALARREDGTRQAAGVMSLHWRRHSVRIYSLAVMPAYRGGGVGARLVRKALAEGRRAGVHYVSLEADRRDRRLIRWYEEFGFETIRILCGYYTPGRDAVRMRRMLSAVPATARRTHG